MLRTGIQIPVGTKIGKGFYIGHFGTIIVSRDAEIGENCSIAAGAVIGLSLGKNKGVPKIGDRVVIGTKTTIIGNIHIGDNVLIGPSTFINFDVPANSIVLGNPGKIIIRENPTKEYLPFTV